MTSPRHVEAGVGVLTVHSTDAMSALRQMSDESVQCVVTSPPYWSLRDYGIEPIVWDETVECEHEWIDASWRDSRKNDDTAGPKQRTNTGSVGDRIERPADVCSVCGAWRGCLGLEPTPELYVQHIVQIFREVKRVLRKDGTLWLNLGDSYAGGGNNRGNNSPLYEKQASNAGAVGQVGVRAIPSSCKAKDLVGIPWLVALALRADGWYLRSDIIWSKCNPMPESVTDRPTRAHEYIFLLTRSQKYYYDAEAIKEPIADSSVQRINQANFDNQTGGEKDYSNGTNPNRSARKALENFAKGRTGKNAFRGQGQTRPEGNGRANRDGCEMKDVGAGSMRNKRSVWEIPTAPFPEAHFATFPKDLVVPCILAGSKAGDVILDPFAGSGTVGKVAIELGRKAILIEPNPEYVKMIEKRTTTTMGLPL